jgi:hypothetical protein
MPMSLAAHWDALEDHFENHAGLVDRFTEADRAAVLRMWKNQTNEAGVPLSHFERDALIERHCELFGTWPDLVLSHSAQLKVRYRIAPAEPEHSDLQIAETERRIADQRNRLARLERLGGDTQLSKSLLVTFEASLQLKIARRNGRVWALT